MIIQSTNVWYEEKFQPLQIEIKENKIWSILPYNYKEINYDFNDNRILPGLLDIHCHGWNGNDTCSISVEGLHAWSAHLPKEGVTGFCPTGGFKGKEEDSFEGFNTVAKVIDEKSYSGAEVLGINLEAVWIGEKYKLGVDIDYQMVPDVACVDRYIKACNGHLKYVMVAPEMLRSDMSIISYMTSKGITVGAGHTDASFADITAAKTAGLTGFVHVYNLMKGMHHRDLGTVGAAFYYEDMYAEIIGDSNLESDEATKLLARIKGKDHLVIVTDATALKGYAPGLYSPEELRGLIDHFNKSHGEKIRITDEDGYFDEQGIWRGSGAKMNYQLKRFIEKIGVDEVTAINGCTCNPAKYLHLNNKGYICQGYDADITVLNKDYDVIQTFVGGKEML